MTRRPTIEPRLFYPVDRRADVIFADPMLQPVLPPIYQASTITAIVGSDLQYLSTARRWMVPGLTSVATPLAPDHYVIIRAVVKGALTTRTLRTSAWVDATGLTAEAIAVQLGWSATTCGKREPDVRRVQLALPSLLACGVLCVRDGAYSTPQIVAAADESPSDTPTGSTQLTLF